MYYEEQWVNGALCWRTDPAGVWIAYTSYELGHRYQAELKRAADAQATVEALQRENAQLKALVRAYGEAKVAFDDGRLREDHHAWKERFERLTGAEQALIATLDATTPATMDAAETHDRMFNHADRHPEAL